MSKGKQAANTPPSIDGGAPLHYCHTCQKKFVNADGLRMHCRSSKAHRKKSTSDLVPVSSTDKSEISLALPSLPSSSPAKKRTFNCNICDRKFFNKDALWQHKRDSQNHRDPANAKSKASRRNISPGIGIARAGSEANGTVSGGDLDDIEDPEELVDYYYFNLEDQLWTVALPVQLSLSAPPPGFQSPFLNDDSDLRISLAAAIQGAQQDLSVRSSTCVSSSFSETCPELDEAEGYGYNEVSFTSLDTQEEDTNAGRCKIPSSPSPPPEVPESWSLIALSERDEVLAALQAQCHSTDCLKKEGYWTQTPSAVDIDMTRKCRDCGGEKTLPSQSRDP
ncbi:C2H2-type zinc finger protein [Aspergillus stella-maris]|uniref:C2H2-type zinc finger protein n=1 Tax=Aspergillus stella-maris TaxID=1810926 RepID=UPI003CCC94A4